MEAQAQKILPAPPTGLLLTAVGAIVLLVSLPRMASYAAMDNASDARLAVRLLGEAACAQPPETTAWLALLGDRSLRHRLQDARPVGLGAEVRHHGYLLTRIGAESVLAWPERPGPESLPAFLWTQSSGVRELPAAPWSGPLPAGLTAEGLAALPWR
ncbi:MAG: hypothetical protein ISQ08_01735 [Planctomycetes bacterium]|nr:hypothetical protein [Planctomycetota bacterium]MDA0947396.1 hypothetical protein [Planctomycetota bacterium]